MGSRVVVVDVRLEKGEEVELEGKEVELEGKMTKEGGGKVTQMFGPFTPS